MKVEENWIDQAKRNVTEIGKELISNTKNSKYPFRQSWLNDLFECYTKRPGKFAIGLADLPDKVCVSFSPKGKSEIKKKFYKFYSNQSMEKLAQIFGWGLIYYLKGRQQSISLDALKRVGKELKFNLKNLEKYVTRVKPSTSSKIITIKLPLNMVSREGAIILGIFPDVGISRYVLSCKDKELVDEFRKVSKKLLGFFNDKNPKNKGKMRRYYATNFLRDVCSIAGYDTSQKQICGNNSIPLWIFLAPSYFLKLYLQRMWDAEGTVSKRDKRLKFAQSVAFSSRSFYKLFKLNQSLRFKILPSRLKRLVLMRPPFLLTSMQLLLATMGIKSRIYPERIKTAKDNLIRCEWSLRITSYEDVQTFAKKAGFSLKRKEKILRVILKSYRQVKIRERRVNILKSIKRNKVITTQEVAKILGLSKISAYFYLRELQANELISCKIGKLIRGKYRPTGFIYEITEKGKNF